MPCSASQTLAKNVGLHREATVDPDPETCRGKRTIKDECFANGLQF